MTSPRPEQRPPHGTFPFPRVNGPGESPYLTWIRNHSNYMAVRGLSDYVRIAAMLARGAILNFLIATPWMILLAIFVAYHKVKVTPSAYAITPVVASLGLGAVLFSPLGALLMRAFNYRKTRQSGSESSVRFRDVVERIFGGALVLIVASAAFETLPHLLDPYHRVMDENGFSFPAVIAMLGAALAVYSVADRVLGRLGGVSKKLAMLAIGGLGIVVPLIFVLFVANFLVFGHATAESSLEWVAIAGLLAVSIPLVVLVAWVRGALSRGDALAGFVMVVGAFALVAAVSYADDQYTQRFNNEREDLPYALKGVMARASTLGVEEELEDLKHELARHTESAFIEFARKIDETNSAPKTTDRPAGAPAAAGGRSRRCTLPDSAQTKLTELSLAARDAHVWEAEALARDFATCATVAPSAGRLVSEIDDLLNRVSALRDVVTPDSATSDDLVHRLLNDVDLEYKLRWMDRPDSVYVALAADSTRLRKVDAELERWATAVRDVRMEAAAEAMSSLSRYPKLYNEMSEPRAAAATRKMLLVFLIGIVIMAFCWVAVDVNNTSVHGLWRDRLAAAFLVGADTKGDVAIEQDIDLGDLCRHSAGSVAPYHLVNVALNLQGSSDSDLRDRGSDFFIFSKRFIGGRRTGYCRSEAMERVYPQMGLGAAMAISAAAASPNMGRETSPALVAFMTLINVRLGVWLPNPGRLQNALEGRKMEPGSPGGFVFSQVFAEEMPEIQNRWRNLEDANARALAGVASPTVEHGLVGLAFSGGGIRSATLNLGIAQALQDAGVFSHVDYLSTVSGGGFIGSSISAIMRYRTPTETDVAGVVSYRKTDSGEQIVEVLPDPPTFFDRLRNPQQPAQEKRIYQFKPYARVVVNEGDHVHAGQRLLRPTAPPLPSGDSLGEVLRWRVPPKALLKEALSRLDEKWRWVNVSDGGHIENLATMELVRRRCKFIIVGDGEADPHHRFTGLATLIRTARIDLGVTIDIDVDPLRLNAIGCTQSHWVAGRIEYPAESGRAAETGWLLYFKSSMTGDEDEDINEYRAGRPTFPHESTADQNFTEGQFEAYRSLGEHIASDALRQVPAGPMSYAGLQQWFTNLVSHSGARPVSDGARPLTTRAALST